jgi:tetratricopeptide (TPR) repeat protein
MRIISACTVIAAVAVVGSPAHSQTFPDHMALGDSLTEVLEPQRALEQYGAAVAVQPGSYEALWKFALAHIDVARQLTDEDRADSLYAVAREYAERAVAADSMDAEGHFVLAYALGQVSRSKGGKERVRYGKEIYAESSRALALNPNHAGAHHVMGAWHAEIKRLSGIARFFAKTFLGGGFMSIASWDSSLVHLAMSIGFEPEHIFHRLELAEILVDVGHYDRARSQLMSLLDLPIADVEDVKHKETAAELLEKISGKS